MKEKERALFFKLALIATSQNDGDPFELIGEIAPTQSNPDNVRGWGAEDQALQRKLKVEGMLSQSRRDQERAHRAWLPRELSSIAWTIDEIEDGSAEE